MKQEIVGAFEAKTHLSSLLDRAAGGTRFIITKRGLPVAELIPYTPARDRSDLAETLTELRAIRKTVGGTGGIIELRDEGRER